MPRELATLLAGHLNTLSHHLGENPQLDYALDEMNAFFTASDQLLRATQQASAGEDNLAAIATAAQALAGLRLVLGISLSSVHPALPANNTSTQVERGGFHRWWRPVREQRLPTLPPRLHLRGADLVEAIRIGLEACDDQMTAAQSVSPPLAPSPAQEPRGWADDDDLLDLLQDLLADAHSGDADMALDRVTRLPRELRAAHEIEVEHYDGSNDGLFEVQDGANVRSLRPALLRKGTVIRRGLARSPRTISQPPED